MSIIKINDLRKNYGELKAVDGISFSVKEGEIFGILGPNGAGKTTTLEMIEGLRKPNGGELLIDGHKVWPDPSKIKYLIGVQLQTTTLFDYLKVNEIILLFASFYDIKLTRQELESLLADVGLMEKSDSYVNQLSGVQQQRLSIALALVNNPKVVFLDEPTTGLDPQARRNLWDVVRKINQEGKTVVITTHYMEEAEVLCERIAIMDKGKIISLDTPSNLIKSLGVDSKITFTCHPEIPKEKLESINGVRSISSIDHSYAIYSDNVQGAVVSVFEIAGSLNAKIDDLNISGANLEDVFLKFTGRALRD
ncbi:MAG: ABC transporter ATP-binding protein [Actinobacteria bacterium]|nr:ABC transporter ATP-binding protein [Actinomycetota bacterium]